MTPRWLAPAGVALAAGLFTWLNRGERAVVHLGFATFYRAPLTVVLFLAFLAGMLAMLALSLRHDLRMRQELRARGLLDGPPLPGASGRPAVTGATGFPAAHGHAPTAPGPEETVSFTADDHTAPFPADGAADHHGYPAEGGRADDSTLGHRRDVDPPLN